MILKQLKTRTATLHKETEENNLAKYILDHSITIEQYQSLLTQNYKAYVTLSELSEKHMKLIDDDLKTFADAQKSEALKRDLKQLNVAIPEKINLEIPENISPFFLLGVLYVAEGSMMGGLLIRKNLEACTNLKCIEDHHFFGKSAPEVLNRWKSFTEAVETKTYTDAEIDEAVSGANFAFSVFKHSY
ncbi:biliverdin-producing heme oxygenase [Leeuwenhoekiella sp. MAR_2009_132]|uniref:biliverdin-producing heme oxygenase n=1 Tax=Leeuwenhoekiella sp. MAR_2009_132 TaxID=1392489 RepID=UPI00048E6668|nr:biliverdin-producing heme oxygenase [Leeuwenhoekiella sp. MAR_2009_132]